MADISKITLPNGNTYDIKDSWARSEILGLEAIDNGVKLVGVTTTALTDGATTSSIQVNGSTYTPVKGDLIFAPTTAGDTSTKEFLYDGENWHLLDALNSYGSLATKNAVSVKYDKASVNTKTFTGTAVRLVTGNIPVPATYTSTFTGTEGTVEVSGTANGNITTTTATTENKTATVAPASSGTATYTPAGTVTQPTFTGSELTSTGSFKPAGTVAAPTFTGTGVRLVTGNISVPTSAALANRAVTASATYTPAGGVSLSTTSTAPAITGTVSTTSTGNTFQIKGSNAAPTISVKTAGTTDTIQPASSTTVAKTVVAAAPGATAPANSLTYYSVSDETLSLYQLGYTTGASITLGTAKTFKTGDAAYQSTAPTFTGQYVKLTNGAFDLPTGASFSGTEATISSSGNVTSGTVTLTNSNKSTTVSPAASGEATYTPAGTNSAPGFTGTSATVTVKGTPDGTVSQPTFSGTGVRLVTGNIAVPKTYTSTFSGGTISASGNFTPAGTVATSTATTANKTTTVSKAASGDTTFTPEGTINVTLTQNNTNATVSYS